jgi:DNA-binding Lrp family transcriptional regulator
MSYRKIADEMGCSVHAAHERVQRALAAVPAEAVEAIRAIEGERLTEAIAVALTELRRDHIMVSHGRIVRDEDGNALIDHGGKLAALHAYVKASESYRKLMGADLPVEQHARVTIEHTTTLDAEIEQLVAAMTPADDRTANA